MRPVGRALAGFRTGLIVAAMLLAVPVVLPSPSGPAPSGAYSIGASGGTVEVAPAYLPSAGTVDLGAVPPATVLDVAVGLAPTNETALTAELASEYSPGSPTRGVYLTPEQVAERYAPTTAAYLAAVQYFTAHGATVRSSPDRWMLLVQGPASAIAASFHTRFDRYASGSTQFFEHPSPASLPGIAPWAGALGLGNASVARPGALALSAGSPSASCTASAPLPPCAVASAYNVSSLLGAGTNGTGYRIGVVDTYDGGEPQPTLQSDLATFAGSYGLRVGSVHYLYPVPTSRNLNNSYPGWAGEDALDLQWSRASAPGASIDMTLAPDPAAGLYFSVDYLVANHLVDVISLSWGEPDVGIFNSFSTPCSSACNATSDGSYQILHPVLAAAALEGIGVFAASGDCGAAMGTNGVSTSYPASDPNAVGVGATDLTLRGTKWGGETGWSGNESGSTSPGCVNGGGSGGGYSPFPRPYWQVAPGLPSTPAVRGVPDLSIVGGTPVSVVMNGYGVGLAGTSVSTPIWAGLAAVADQDHGATLGFLGPSLYALARSPSASTYFHSITSGSNGYSAHSGWNPVTGLGTPNASGLIPALSALAPTPTGPAPIIEAVGRTGAVPLNVTFRALVPPGAPPVAGYDVYFGDGNSSWTSSGSTSYTYRQAGVFGALAEVFYADGNSSESSPALVLAGAGPLLAVNLTANTTSPATNAPVLLTPGVSGGLAPYRYSYYFGDGTYYLNTTVVNWTHRYAAAGAYCAAVTIRDASSPPAGGVSLDVPIAVGGASASSCEDQSPLSIAFGAQPAALDLPANVNLTTVASGGVAPYVLHFVSDDPYVTECQCGIFRIPGNHTVRVFANDSVGEAASAGFNVTVYGALAGSFSGQPTGTGNLAPLIGNAPMTLDFTAELSGGHLANADTTVWTFGDGSPPATGASVAHTFGAAGFYVVGAVAHDTTNGTAAHAFLVDVLPAGATGVGGVGVDVEMGPGAAAGNVVHLSAYVTAAGSSPTVRWQLGDNDSAFGAVASQSYTTGCLAASQCPLRIGVNVSAGNATVAAAAFALPFNFFGRSSALTFTDTATGTGGASPYVYNGTAATFPMPGAQVGWAFGDGNSSTGTPVTHTFLLPGNFTVTETATDTIGDVELRTHAVSVTSPPVSPLLLHGGPPFTEGIAPFAATFEVAASGGYGVPYAYDWQFGDGGTATGGWVNHTYNRTGEYRVNATAHDRQGTSASESWNVSVFLAARVTMLVSITPALAAPGGAIALSVTPKANCSGPVVPTCSDANVTWTVSAPGLSSPFPGGTAAGGTASLSTVAPAGAGIVQVWVNATGFYHGSAQTVVEVRGPSAAPNGFYAVALVAGIAGVVAAAGIWIVFRARRRPPTTP